MQVSAMTHSPRLPFGYRRLAEINFAADLAMSIVCFSSDSRTPPSRPSIVGRMPILGREPLKREGYFMGIIIGLLCFHDGKPAVAGKSIHMDEDTKSLDLTQVSIWCDWSGKNDI